MTANTSVPPVNLWSYSVFMAWVVQKQMYKAKEESDKRKDNETKRL